MGHAPPHPLAPLGWDEARGAEIGPEDAGLEPARVVAELGARFELATSAGLRLADPSGRLRRDGERPVIGDFVLASPRRDGDATIERILTRRTQLSRNAAGRRTEEQVLAANVDTVLLVQAIGEDFNPRRLERTLAAIFAGGATPVVLLNKADLADDPDDWRALLAPAAPGVAVELVSAKRKIGLDAVLRHLRDGHTAVLAGSSGVGKSTLVNALLGSEVQRVGEVREADDRGRHVTTNRRLFLLPGGGCLVDGPGLRELQLWGGAGLAQAFADLEEVAAGCRFGDCSHEGEPGCAIDAALEAEDLDPERVASWLKLRAEAREHEARKDPALRAEERRKGKIAARALRRVYRDRGEDD